MSTNALEVAESLTDDIFSTTAYEALPPADRPFLPWHRPRKQFVRDKQWAEQIDRLYEESEQSRSEFRYLGLPGIDLLDLRYFHSRICEPRGLEMSFLGFNMEAQDGSRAQIELNVSLDEVRKLSSVNSRSIVIPDDFCAVANDTSVAYKKAIDVGPYDVINIDLCDGLGSESSGPARSSTHDAIAQLLSLQFRHKHPWLLLLTTRVGHAHVEKEFLEKLVVKYVENLTKCKEFRDHSQELFTIGDVASLGSALGSDAGLLPVYLTSVSKWLVGLALASNPPSKIELRSVIGYRVEHSSDCEDLCSLAFRFTPVMSPVADPMGITTSIAAVPDECRMAVAALKRVSKRKDADALLAADDTLRLAMTNGMSDLLVSARYSKTRYEAWIATEDAKLA